jgi:hypothetical protein
MLAGDRVSGTDADQQMILLATAVLGLAAVLIVLKWVV